MKNEDGRMKDSGVGGQGPEDGVREVGTGPIDQLRLISRTIDSIGNIYKMSILYWLYDEDAGRIANYVPVKKEGEAIEDAVVRAMNVYSTGLVDLLISWMQTLRKVGITDVMIDERLRLICEIAKDRVKQDVREGDEKNEESIDRGEGTGESLGSPEG